MPYETPSTPKQSIVYSAENTSPQQNFSFWGDPRGMVVYTGRLKKVNNKIGFVCLVNNVVKGAAGLSIQNAEAFLKKKADTIIVAPPRSGMSKKAIKNLLSYKIERVIYISCSYINAIRDIKDMTGYKIESITPFDMFHKTHHTECVVLMGKTVTRSKSHVNLGLDVEDYYKIEDAEKEQE